MPFNFRIKCFIDTKSTPQRNYTIDLLRVLAIIGVVVIHVTSRNLENSGYDILRLNFSLILNQLFRFAVPLFFLISGFTLEYRYLDGVNTKLFYKKRFTKLLIPYILWSGFYFLFNFDFSIVNLLSFNFIYQLLLGSAAIQMYFIPAIAILYLIFPLIHKNIRFLFNSRIFLIFTIFQIFLFFVDYYIAGINIPTPLRISLLNIYIFSTGMMGVHKIEIIKSFIQKKYKLILVILIISFAVMFFESKTNYLNSQNINYITSQWRWDNTLYTLSLTGLVLVFVNLKSDKIKKLFLKLSRFTFFVFFIHLFIITLFWKVIGSYLFSRTAGHISESILFDIGVSVFVIFFSYLIAYILSFIPKVGWLVGIESK